MADYIRRKNLRPTECIYCGSKDLTKEHFFPDWLRNHIDPGNHSLLDIGQGGADNYGSTYDETRKIPGSTIDWSPKIVCRSCNNGWMSKFQNLVKPTLLTALTDFPTLNASQQKFLAAWGCMFAMSVEFYTAKNVIPLSEKQHLKSCLEPSARWAVWIGRYLGGERAFSYRQRSMVLTPLTGSGEPEGMYTTTLTLGKIMLQMHYSDARDFPSSAWVYPEIRGLQKIHPQQRDFIHTPLTSYGDQAFEAVSDVMVGRAQELVMQRQAADA